MVKDSVQGTGLHPEIVIAQMAIESGWGGSGLSVRDNNFFGIKSYGKSGGKTWATKEERDGKMVNENASFRGYESAEDSIKGYVDFMQTNPRYKKAGVFDAKTPEEQADAIQSAGYSTSSTYSSAIKQTMSANKNIIEVMSDNKNETKVIQGEDNKTFRLPTEEEMDDTSPRDKWKKMNENLYKDKNKRKTEFQSGKGNKKDRYQELTIKSKSKGLTKAEMIEARDILNEAKDVYDGGADFKRMNTAMRNDLAFNYLKDEYKYNSLKGAQDLKNLEDNLSQASPEERENLQKEFDQKQNEYNNKYGANSQTAVELSNLEQNEYARKNQLGSGDPTQRNKVGSTEGAYAGNKKSVETMSKLGFYKSLGADNEDIVSPDMLDEEPTGTDKEAEANKPTASSEGSTPTNSAAEKVSTGVEDRGGVGGTTTNDKGETITAEKVNWEEKYKEASQNVEDLRNVNQDDFVHDYKTQSGNNDINNLIDAGRGIVGAMGANEEIPEYERGAMFSEAMGDAQRMKEQGLSPDELNLRKKLSERAYAYDVKNIGRMAVGSAGVALGNLGRATGQLQDEYSKIAATDEAVRRGNQGAFRSMALQDESINRQIFKDDLTVTMANKEAGAGLVQDAISNIRERGDYNKMYGEGSIYANRMKTLDKKEQMAMHDLKKGNESRVFSDIKAAEKVRDDAKAQMDKASNLSVTGTSADRKSMFNNNVNAIADKDGKLSGGTFTRKEPEALPEPKRGMFKAKKSAKSSRADEITSMMQGMSPDNPKFMKLSKELDGIKL